MAKEIVVGNAPYADILIGKFYLNEAGEKFEKAGDVGGKYSIDAAYNIKIGIPADMPEDVKQAAVEHSFERKMQERFGSVFSKNQDANFDEVANGFIDYYYANLRGEKAAREGRAEADPIVGAALAKLVAILKEKTDEQLLAASTPVDPSLAPLTKNGKRNYLAWAKVLQGANHPWYQLAYKKASDQKGFD